ncbi:MAG: hypothetical protein ACI30R_01200, partial [Sodaliphilus sp.]
PGKGIYAIFLKLNERAVSVRLHGAFINTAKNRRHTILTPFAAIQIILSANRLIVFFFFAFINVWVMG